MVMLPQTIYSGYWASRYFISSAYRFPLQIHGFCTNLEWRIANINALAVGKALKVKEPVMQSRVQLAKETYTSTAKR